VHNFISQNLLKDMTMDMQKAASISVRLLLVGALIGTPIHGMESKKIPVIVLVVGALGFVAYKLYQSMPHVYLFGSSHKTMSVNQQSFFAMLAGSSKLTVSGKVSAQKICASGSSQYHGSALISETAHLNLTGSSKVYLNVTGEITGYIADSCKVYALGNPVSNLKLLGSAEYHDIGQF
jgi:hypothetical protein